MLKAGEERHNSGCAMESRGWEISDPLSVSVSSATHVLRMKSTSP